MAKSNSILKNTSGTAQVAESHISLGILGWTMLVGGSGGTGLIGLLRGITEGLAWYDIALSVILGVLISAFAIFGIMAFVQSLKASKRREGQMNTEDAWGKKPFENYQTCAGGTHTLADIFRGDKIRTKMIFRDCMISGPGIVAFTGCAIKNFAIHGNGMPMVIEGHAAGTTILYINEFFECSFENVTFSNCLLVGNGIVPDGAPHATIEYKNMPDPTLELDTVTGDVIANP